MKKSLSKKYSFYFLCTKNAVSVCLSHNDQLIHLEKSDIDVKIPGILYCISETFHEEIDKAEIKISLKYFSYF